MRWVVHVKLIFTAQNEELNPAEKGELSILHDETKHLPRCAYRAREVPFSGCSLPETTD
jgi:hypothetical protein